jgi:murein DD-endopeptidase MepM/ murein hydrolase activator NlpD
MNMPLLIGAILGGAVVIDFGVKNTRQAFAASPAGGTSPAPATSGSGGAVSTTPALPGQYVAPLPAGVAKVGRTDQGVDVSAPAGTPIHALGASKVMGIIPNWYSGQPFVWFQLLDGPNAGRFWYAAEQLLPSVRAGDTVAAGQQIGTVAGSGTGLEFGWATGSGETQARATTGYTEGQVTAAGQDFAHLLTSLGL